MKLQQDHVRARRFAKKVLREATNEKARQLASSYLELRKAFVELGQNTIIQIDFWTSSS